MARLGITWYNRPMKTPVVVQQYIPQWLLKYILFLLVVAFIGTMVVLFLIEPTPELVVTPLTPIVQDTTIPEAP